MSLIRLSPAEHRALSLFSPVEWWDWVDVRKYPVPSGFRDRASAGVAAWRAWLIDDSGPPSLAAQREEWRRILDANAAGNREKSEKQRATRRAYERTRHAQKAAAKRAARLKRKAA